MIKEMISLIHLQINIFFLEMQKICITDLKYQNQNLKKVWRQRTRHYRYA